MDFNESLICHRKRMGWSQEELGYRIGVSRQAISKWESGATTPEMDKLIKMSGLFEISVDELLGLQTENASSTGGSRSGGGYQYKSRKTIAGLPLVHINTGPGLRHAKGIIAIGNISTGVISIGAVSIGLISIGAVSIGIGAFAALAIGLLACGGISFGLIAAGGIATGYLAVGGLARGIYAVGGYAAARDIAIGGVAHGYIAAGESVSGVLEFQADAFSEIPVESFRRAIVTSFPEINRRILDLLTTM